MPPLACQVVIANVRREEVRVSWSSSHRVQALSPGSVHDIRGPTSNDESNPSQLTFHIHLAPFAMSGLSRYPGSMCDKSHPLFFFKTGASPNPAWRGLDFTCLLITPNEEYRSNKSQYPYYYHMVSKLRSLKVLDSI